MNRNYRRAACVTCLVTLLAGRTALAGGLIHAPAVPQPTAPGDLVGVVLENTLNHPLAPRFITFGTSFAPGQLPQGEGLTAVIGGQTEPAQIDVKNHYKDGSALFGIVTLRAPAMGGGADAAVMLRKSAPAGGRIAILPALRKQDVTITLALHQPNMPTRYVTYDAAKLFAAGRPSPWLSGPLVTGARVQKHVTGALRLVLDLRAYASGGIEADVELNNDIAMSRHGGAQTYGITISQAGRPVFAVPSIHQFQYQDWHTIIRSGGRSPINVVHDIAAMERTGIIPAYNLAIGMPRLNLIRKLKAITSPGWDAPLAVDGVTQYMPMTGGRGSIGPTTAANATWLITQNPVAAEYALGQADTSGAVPWHFYYRKTGTFVTTADFPNLWVDGRGGPGSYTTGLTQQVGKTGWATDVAHEPDLAFIPYLLTGRRYYLDQQNAEADYSEVGQWPAKVARNEGQGIIVGPGEQVRGAAWSLREVSDAAFIDPDGTKLRPYFQHMVANNMAYLKHHIPVWTRQEGHAYGYIAGTYGDSSTMAPWQQDYFAPVMAQMAQHGVVGAKRVLHWEDHFLAGSVLRRGKGFDPRNGITYNLGVYDSKTKKLLRHWSQIQRATEAAGQNNGNGWAHSNGDYGMTRLSALASIYNVTGSAKALRGYNWVLHSGAPFTNIAGLQSTPQFWIVPLPGKSTGK